MSRDTKLRMSISPKIVETLNDMYSQIRKATEHKANGYELRKIIVDVPDSTDYLLFEFNISWSVKRCRQKTDMYHQFSEEGWEITGVGDKVMITTFGKMTTDINREIEELLPQVQTQIDLIEDPVYCPVCEHCGETGCCGYIDFLEKHVRGKTDCIHEDAVLNDLEKWIKEEDD